MRRTLRCASRRTRAGTSSPARPRARRDAGQGRLVARFDEELHVHQPRQLQAPPRRLRVVFRGHVVVQAPAEPVARQGDERVRPCFRTCTARSSSTSASLGSPEIRTSSPSPTRALRHQLGGQRVQVVMLFGVGRLPGQQQRRRGRQRQQAPRPHPIFCSHRRLSPCSSPEARFGPSWYPAAPAAPKQSSPKDFSTPVRFLRQFPQEVLPPTRIRFNLYHRILAAVPAGASRLCQPWRDAAGGGERGPRNEPRDGDGCGSSDWNGERR